jgi:hypothetical protein
MIPATEAMTAPIHAADRAVIRQHLDVLFRRADAIEPGCLVEIAWSETLGGAVDQARLFPTTPAGLDAAAEFAARTNDAAFNTYVGVNPRKPGTPRTKRARGGDVAFALFHFLDGDTQEADIAHLCYGSIITLTVLTGTEPFDRRHLYWELERPEHDLVAWRARQDALVPLMAGDRNARNADRVLRLAGTWSYPKPEKVAKGYRVELVTAVAEPVRVTPEALFRTFGESTPVPEVTASVGNSIDDAKPIGDASLMARDQAELLRIVSEMPNELSYEGWINFTRAFKAACGGSVEGFEVYVDFCLRYPGNTIEAAEAKWESVDDSRLGADYVYRVASGCGVAVFAAANDFDPVADDDVPPADEPGNPASGPEKPKQYAPKPRRLPLGLSPADIAVRPWVLGHRFMRGAVTAGIGAPGVSKSLYSLITGLAIVTGRSDITGEQVHVPGKVWIHNNEDDTDEMMRRLLGLCRHYGIEPDGIRDGFLFSSADDRRLVIATKAGDHVAATDAVREIIGTIKAEGVVYLGLDPLISLHRGVSENSNEEMERVIDSIRQIAREGHCAVDLVHHSAKNNSGNTEARAGDMNAARGASSLVGAVRIAYTLSPMDRKNAKARGIEWTTAKSLVRLDIAKGNYAPKPDRETWFQLHSIEIGNGAGVEDLLGQSDSVGVPVLWDIQHAERVARNAAETARDELAGIIAGSMATGKARLLDLIGVVQAHAGCRERTARDRINEALGGDGRVVELDGVRWRVWIAKDGPAVTSPISVFKEPVAADE